MVGDQRYGYHNDIHGLELWKGPSYLSMTANMHISWDCAADTVNDMINSHEYLSADELDKQADYVDIEPQKEENGEQLTFFDMDLPAVSEGYVLPVEKFPLSIAWYTMFAGMDKNEKGDKNNYSSYVELNYPFSVKSVDLNVTCGIVPYKAPQYYTNGFAVTNVALKGSYAIKITDSFSLPIFSQVIWNPRMEDAHLVFGFTLRP